MEESSSTGIKHLEEDEYQPRTELWRRLMERRRQLIAVGAPLLDWRAINAEIRAGRGDAADDEDD